MYRPMMYFIGDIHGHYDIFLRLLRESGLTGADGHWTGGSATLWLMGDFADRGPDGVGAIELAMRLQHEAAATGGAVNALLGNHDVLLLAAQRFGNQPTTGPGGNFLADWRRNGGEPNDLARLRPEHIAWLAQLPPLARAGDTLLAHADATFYTEYGFTIQHVNTTFRQLLGGNDPAAWDHLLDQFSERLSFTGDQGEGALASFLHTFGANRLIHGHTPISYTSGATPADVTAAFVYAHSRCVNVDGGLYLGGPGFVYLAQ